MGFLVSVERHLCCRATKCVLLKIPINYNNARRFVNNLVTNFNNVVQGEDLNIKANALFLNIANFGVQALTQLSDNLGIYYKELEERFHYLGQLTHLVASGFVFATTNFLIQKINDENNVGLDTTEDIWNEFERFLENNYEEDKGNALLQNIADFRGRFLHRLSDGLNISNRSIQRNCANLEGQRPHLVLSGFIIATTNFLIENLDYQDPENIELLLWSFRTGEGEPWGKFSEKQEKREKISENVSVRT
uniref:HEPN_AbiU2 domain-containing protein n=1 Tax=Meloidogyne hapla TaxID=6305 RepID=A0A1I8BNZ3_MELHA